MGAGEPEEQPQINFMKLSYPSDSLTIGRIRAALPELFAQEDPRFFGSVMGNAAVSGMINWERRLAHKAFAAALGRPDPHPDEEEEDRQVITDMLTETYERFGISSGPQHTLQLIRDLETAAADQARSHIGQTRP